MSELINKTENPKGFRWELLATTSAMVLCAAVGTAKAEDGDHPTVWIELGGQLSHFEDSQEAFAPSFPNSPPRPSMFSSPVKFEHMPRYSVDGTGKLTFEPRGSDWIFSAAVRYGRSISKKHEHQQTYPKSFITIDHYSSGLYHQTLRFAPLANRFADTRVQNSESHTILDFQAGKDVGLGIFGDKNGSSYLNLGIRYAQFSSKSNISFKSDPDWRFNYKYFSNPPYISRVKLTSSQPYHSNAAALYAVRSFQGIGPSISWNASAPVLGNARNGEILLDWGVNAALLFGRQKAKTHHQTTGRYHTGTHYAHLSQRPFRPITFQGPATPDHVRSRTVTVPNIGAFAGATYRIENFKVSAGYRADFFLGAMDNGVDTPHSQTIGFHGPFATISVGLGG